MIPDDAASSTRRAASAREWTKNPFVPKRRLWRCDSVGLRNPSASSASVARSRSAGSRMSSVRGRGMSSRSTRARKRSLSTSCSMASRGAMLAGNRSCSSAGRPATASAHWSLHGMRTARGRLSEVRYAARAALSDDSARVRSAGRYQRDRVMMLSCRRRRSTTARASGGRAGPRAPRGVRRRSGRVRAEPGRSPRSHYLRLRGAGPDAGPGAVGSAALGHAPDRPVLGPQPARLLEDGPDREGDVLRSQVVAELGHVLGPAGAHRELGRRPGRTDR